MDNDLFAEILEVLDDQTHRYCAALSFDPGNEQLIASYEGFERLKVEVTALLKES